MAHVQLRHAQRVSRVSLAVLIGIVPATLVLIVLIPHRYPLDVIMVPAQALLLGILVYQLGLNAFALRAVAPVPAASPRSKFAILVPAHNEATVIPHLIASLRAQTYPSALFTTFVVADNCTDETAAVARASGAVVFERCDPGHGGKGRALDWLLSRVWATGESFDAILVFDADNLVSPGFLQTMDGHLQRGDLVIQAYLGTKNPDDSWVTRAICIEYVYVNRFFQRARHTLGLGTALGGTGMCIAVPLLRQLGWRCESLTEDLEFQIRAILAGARPTLSWEAVVYDEKPLSMGAALRQRQRWMQGFSSVAFRYLGPLVWRALRHRDTIAWDAAIYVGTPIWNGLGFLLGLTALANFVVPFYSFVGPRWLSYVLTAPFLFLPYVGLRLEGLPTRLYFSPSTQIGRSLLALSSPLLGLLGLLTFRSRRWVKTEHTRGLTMEETERLHAELLRPAPRVEALQPVGVGLQAPWHLKPSSVQESEPVALPLDPRSRN